MTDEEIKKSVDNYTQEFQSREEVKRWLDRADERIAVAHDKLIIAQLACRHDTVRFETHGDFYCSLCDKLLPPR